MLADLAQDLRRQDTDLLVAHDLGQVRDVLQRAEVPGIAAGVHPTVDAAVHAALSSTDKDRTADPRPTPVDDPGTDISPAPPARDRTSDG